MSTPPAEKKATRMGAIDKFFKITQRGSSFGTEIRGGLVTFFAMSYIVVLNPLILGGGKDGTGQFLGGGSEEPNLAMIAAATALIAGVMTIMMGLVANFPLGLAAGLGINAIVASSIAVIEGVTWADAMGLVVLEGIIILILVLTGFREAVFKAVPIELKTAISVGIGLFIAFIGLVNAGFVTAAPPGGPPLQLGADGSLRGWPVLVFIVGLGLIIILTVRKVRGAILIGIVTATALAIVVEAIAKIGPKFNAAGDVNSTGWSLNTPALSGSPVAAPDLGLLGHFSLFGSIENIGVIGVVLFVFSLLLADFFDTMGTMVAVGAEADLLDEEGSPEGTRKILVVDSIAAVAGGAAGVSSNTSYVESASGVGEGARTGLASVVTGLVFLLATFFAPVVEIVPYEAATPALVFVGFLMMTQISGIKWDNFEVSIPAYLTIIIMPFAYSITAGIGAGFIAFVVIKLAKGKLRAIHPLMWIASLLFVVYFTLGPIKDLLVG